MSTTTWPLPELPSDRKLSGRSNYVVWAARMTNIMIVENLLGHIFNRDDGMKPFGSDIRYESWARSNARTLLILDLNTLGDANGIVMTFRTAAEVWGALGRAYGGGVHSVAG